MKTNQCARKGSAGPAAGSPVHHAGWSGPSWPPWRKTPPRPGGTSRSAPSCWPRRASQDRGGYGPGSGARGLSATGRHGGPSGAARAAASRRGRRRVPERSRVPGRYRLIGAAARQPARSRAFMVRPWAAGQPCPVPGRPRRLARRAAGRAEVAAQGPRRRRGTPGGARRAGNQARPARGGNQGAQSAAISAPVPPGIQPVSYPGRRSGDVNSAYRWRRR